MMMRKKITLPLSSIVSSYLFFITSKHKAICSRHSKESHLSVDKNNGKNSFELLLLRWFYPLPCLLKGEWSLSSFFLPLFIPSFQFRNAASTKTQGTKKEKRAKFFKAIPKKSTTKPTVVVDTTEDSVPPSSQHGFSQSEIEGFKESFALFDTEQTGSISSVDLYNILKSLQGDTVYPHLEKLLAELSTCSEDDRFDFDDYVALMARTSLHHLAQQAESGDLETNNYKHVFRLFDLDGKGYISADDLQRVAYELGEYDITKEELEEMIQRGDTNQEGRVYLSEFSKIMNLNLFQHGTVK